jgi:hypothetical protein
VGKTYLWKKEVGVAQESKAIGLSKYAYVSLFGQNSLNDIKNAIVEETVDVGAIGKLPNIGTLKGISQLKSGALSWLSRLSAVVPGLRDYVIDASRLLFAALVRNQIVCIDDLDRAGADLAPKDVLGLASFLKEERRCRVVLLLNQDELETESKADFLVQVEKVIDTKLAFQPSASDAARIAISGTSTTEQTLAQNSIKLGITNIRVIQKIKRLSERLEEILKGHDDVILKQAIHSVTLFGWMIYQPTNAPPMSLIAEADAFEFFEKEEKEPTPEEKAWRAVLADYNFTRIDEFDEIILEGVRTGFFDEDKLLHAAKTITTQVQANNQSEAFRLAWRKFHSSFSSSADEVLASIEAAFRDGVQTVGLSDLSATVDLFKRLDEPTRAKALLDHYINAHSNQPSSFFDLGSHPFAGEVKDPDVRTAFSLKHATTVQKLDPAATLKKISENSGWNPEDLNCLADLSVEDFYKLFKATEGPELPAAIKTALQFGAFAGASPEMKMVTNTATDALRRIAGESKINALRLARYGISPS